MVTLDISDTHINVMVVNGRRTEKAASLLLEAGLVKDGIIENKASVGQRIKQLMSEQGITAEKVALCVTGIHSIYRVISLPRMSTDLLDEAVRREMERIMPVPLHELYVFWRTLAQGKAEITIAMVGIPRTIIDTTIEALRHTGLRPIFITIRPLALAKVVDEANAIVINAQSNTFDIVVLYDGIPQLVRSLTFLNEQMSDDEKVKAVKDELEKTVSFYNSSQTHNAIGKNTATYVSGALRELVVPSIDYKVMQLPALLANSGDMNLGTYTASIGLAALLKRNGISPVKLCINILPDAYLPHSHIKLFAGLGFSLFSIILVIIFATLVLQEMAGTSSLQAKVDAANAQVKQIKKDEEALKKVVVKRDETQTLANLYHQPIVESEAQRAKVIRDLSSITEQLPGTVNLESIEYSKGITMKGEAPDKDTILSYARSLRNTNRFSSVMLASMSEKEYNEWVFMFKID